MCCSATRVVPLTLAALALAGCGGKPQVAYSPPVELGDLTAGLAAPDNTYVLLADEPTEGRFACALAIARLTGGEESGGERTVLVATQPNEQAFWTEQMRGIPAIRELLFLSPRSTRAEGEGVPHMCAAAERLGAALLLVYAPNVLGANSAEVLGALYDTSSHEVLATLHASSTILDEDGRQVSPDPLRGDHRASDARYQAQRKFESYALACLRELIQRDAPPATTQPHKWKKPWNERWWVPRQW